LAAQRAGVAVPERCAVLGFGDYAFARMLIPRLTTIRPPAREIGELAAQRVLAAVTNPAEVLATSPLTCELVVRDSL